MALLDQEKKNNQARGLRIQTLKQYIYIYIYIIYIYMIYIKILMIERM